MKKLRTAVVGFGYMGSNHARIYNNHNDVDLIAICDAEKSNANSFMNSNPIFYKNVNEILDLNLDIVSICVPTGSHFDIAKKLISKKINVLIEKPITNSISDAEELIKLSDKVNVILGVGHIERFNPVVKETKNILTENILGEIYQINVNRMGPNPNRKLDTGVFLDLATHDIDILRYLFEEDPVSIYSRSKKINKKNKHEDMGSSMLTFPGNKIVNINVNWVSPIKIREMIIIGSEGMAIINFITQDLNLYENNYNDLDWGTMNILKGSSEGKMTKLSFKRDEPLKIELDEFISAVKNKAKFSVDGKEGMKSLKFALEMINSANKLQ